MVITELNDWQLRVFDDNRQTLYEQPAGVAYINQGFEFGDPAFAESRAHPQQFNSQYLHRLNADPLSVTLGSAKNHADLIYHHFLTLPPFSDAREAGGTIVDNAMCVPSHITNPQLGLLLGILGEAAAAPIGFIDSALAYSLDIALPLPYYVFDVELHRVCLTEVSQAGTLREVSGFTTFDNMGLSNIIDGWLNVIADEFVQKTRFDPLHAGASEQQLLDQVRGWLTGSNLSDQRVEVNAGDHVRDIEIGHAVLRDKLQQRLDACELGNLGTLVITPRVNRVPGLRDLLENHATQLVAASDEHFLSAAYRMADTLDDSQVERLRAAPNTTAQIHSQTDIPVVVGAVTHLLEDNTAIPVNGEEFRDHINGNGTINTTSPVQVNGRPAPTASLKPGDVVTFGHHTYIAIVVE